MKHTKELSPTFKHIIEVTEKLIKEKGCNHTRLKDILQESGVSKGGLYHYVRSKDELFGMILQSKMLITDDRFTEVTKQAHTTLADALTTIFQGMTFLYDQTDITNNVFIYLLGRKEEPAIADILSDIYQHTLHFSISWIKIGQEAGVIKERLDARKTAEQLVTQSFGLRIQAIIGDSNLTVLTHDYYDFMYETLSNE